MKSIGKQAAALVSKAVGALRRKAGVLRARLLFLASSRRRAAVLAGISRHVVRAFTTPRKPPCQDKTAAAAQQHYCRGACGPLAPADDDDDDDEGVAVAAGGLIPHHLPVVVPASLLLVVQEGDGVGSDDGGWCAAADWTLALRSLFDDDEDGHRDDGDGCLVAAATAGHDEDGEDGTSVMDVIRRPREGDGQEFRIEDEIDRAADMYIARVRRRLSAQLLVTS